MRKQCLAIAPAAVVLLLTATPAIAGRAGPAVTRADTVADQDAAPAPFPLNITAAQIEHIRRALNQPTPLKLDENQIRFYLQVVAKAPRWSDYVKGYDFINGPTKRGSAMSHEEFLAMVTPKEMYSSAGITAVEQVEFALTNYLAQSLLKKAIEEVKNAKSDREVEEIRQRIERELEALRFGSR